MEYFKISRRMSLIIYAMLSDVNPHYLYLYFKTQLTDEENTWSLGAELMGAGQAAWQRNMISLHRKTKVYFYFFFIINIIIIIDFFSSI